MSDDTTTPPTPEQLYARIAELELQLGDRTLDLDLASS
jgi:hypothetical protein